MIALEQWFPLVLVHVRGAPDPLVTNAIRRAAREFFKRTRVWTEWLDATLATGTHATEYDFDLPTGSELVRVEQATVNGNPLPVQSYRQLLKDWTSNQVDGPSIVSRELASFHLAGSFSPTDSIQAQVSLMPSVSAKSIPDTYATRYQEAIAEGAKAILLMVPGDFYDPQGAQFAKSIFEAAINSAAVDAYRSHTNNVPRSTPKWC